MLESTEQDFKFESNEDFWEKCKNTQQKEEILKFLHTDDSYYCGLKVYAKSIEQVEDRDIKIQLIFRLDEDDLIIVVDTLQVKHFQKLIKNDNNKKDVEKEEEKDDEESTLTFDYFLSYFLNKDFNEFSSPMEILWFLQKCAILNSDYRLIFPEYFENNFKKLFNGENFDIHNYFYTGRKNKIKIMCPKQEFFDLCVEKNLGAWAGFAFVYWPRSKQTKENFLKIPSEFRVSTFAFSIHKSWNLIDCLSKDQKQELVDKKIITKEHFLNKKAAKIWSTVLSICSAIALAGLIASCIFAPALGPILAPISIALYAFATIFVIIDTICCGHNLYKINKFNEEIAQSETTTLANDTNNPIVAVENENAQGNDSKKQTDQIDRKPPMDNQNQIGNQNPNHKEP